MQSQPGAIAPTTSAASSAAAANLEQAPEHPPGHADYGAALADERPHVVKKVGRRLMWFLIALYFCAIMDRGNISFAALTMNKDVGLTAQIFGIGISITFITYSLFELPSNLMLARFGARITLTRIAILWGIASMLMVFIQGPASYFGLRALLGAAEAGLFPGVMLYLSYWMPFAYRARYNAMFNYAAPLSYVFTALISSSILSLDGLWGITGWRWLFLLEGLPTIALGVFGAFYLTNRPAEATWLPADEKQWLVDKLERERAALGAVNQRHFLRSLGNPVVLLLGLCNFCLFCGLTTPAYWMPQMLRAFDYSYREIGFAMALPPLAGWLGMVLMARRSDRKLERVHHTAFALLLGAFGFALVGISHTPQMIVAGFMLADIGLFATQAIFWTIPQSYLAKHLQPGVMGCISTVGSIGGAVMPAVIGHLKDQTHTFVAAFLVLGAVFLVAMCAILLAGRRIRAAQSSGVAA